MTSGRNNTCFANYLIDLDCLSIFVPCVVDEEATALV